MNRKKLRFSVIMCCYNLGKLVNEAIESVLNQSFTNFELLLVNDGSSDNTLKYLEKFAESDPRVVLIDNAKNIGLSASRNKAIKRAKGEYIVHLDGDDTLYDYSTLENINKTLGNENYDVCYFGVQYVGGSNQAYIPNAQNSTREARIVCDMHFAVASKVWRRKFLKETKLSFIEGMYYEDMVYSIKAAILANKLGYGSFPIYYYYRNREGSIMATPNVKRCKDMYKMLYYLMELYSETPEHLQPYLLSFIKNETFGVPVRVDGIIKSLKDSTYTPVFPKRNYVYVGDTDNISKYDESFGITASNNSNVIPMNFEEPNNNPNFMFNPAKESIAAENLNKKLKISGKDN